MSSISVNELVQDFKYNYNGLIAIPNFIQIISATVFFYYSILHFEDEITHIWSQKWTWGKAMFLATRYSGALFSILLIVSMIGNFDGVVMLSDGDTGFIKMSRTETLACLKGYLYSGLGMVPILLAEGILALRVCAIYNKSKRVLVLLMFLLLCSFAVSVAQASGALTTAVENTALKTNNPNNPFSATNVMVISFESIFFTMVFAKYRKRGRPDLHSSSVWCDLLAFLARDSTVYYAIIFICTSFPTVLSFVNETSSGLSGPGVLYLLIYQLNPFQAIVITVMSLLAPQMIINLRRKQYQYSLGPGRDASYSSGSVSHSQERRHPQDSNLNTFNSRVLDY